MSDSSDNEPIEATEDQLIALCGILRAEGYSNPTHDLIREWCAGLRAHCVKWAMPEFSDYELCDQVLDRGLSAWIAFAGHFRIDLFSTYHASRNN